MATNLDLDPELLDAAHAVSGERTKKATVTLALRELIAMRQRQAMVEHFHTMDWDPDYDYKAERSR